MDAAAPPAGDLPSPIPGMDWEAYRNFLMRALSGDDNVPAAVLTRVKVSRSGDSEGADQRDHRWFRDFLLRRMIEQQLEEIDRLIAQYNEMADWHREQADAARERMTEAADRLAEIDEFISGVNDLLEEKARTGKLDREKAIEILRTRGVEVDPGIDDEALGAALMAENNKAAVEKGRWSRQYEHSGDEAKRHEELERESLRKAEELFERRDAIRKDGYDLEEEERLLQQVTEEYRRDVQRKALKLEELRNPSNQPTGPVEDGRQEAMNNSQHRDEEADFLASMDNLTATYNLAAADAPSGEPSPDAPTAKWPNPGGPGSAV